jgi:uncharacterized repeat protein (TIGR01451 family)
VKAFVVIAWVLALGRIAAAEDIRRIDLPTNDLVYDTQRGKLYASVPSGANSNSIAVIDPVGGTIESFVPVGAAPARLALSDDHGFLYVGLNGTGGVARVNLATLTVDLEFSLGISQQFNDRLLVDDMVVMPGNANAVAIARMESINISTPSYDVAIFDNGIMRSNTVSGLPPARIQFSKSAARLYGTSPYFEPGYFYRMNVDASGVVLADETVNLISSPSCYRDIRFNRDDGLVYTAAGEVVDPEALTLVGNFSGVAGSDDVVPDSATGRTYFITYNGELLAYDQISHALIRFMQGPVNTDPLCCLCYSMVRWGFDGLAYRTTDGHLYLVQGCVVRSADLGVQMTSQPNPPVLGSHVAYSITVTNKGQNDATSVVLTDPLPPGLTFVSGVPGFVQTGSVASCLLGTLGSGTSTSVTLVASAVLPGILVNTALVAAAECDPHTNDNLIALPVSDITAYGVLKTELFAQYNGGAARRIRDTPFVFVATVDQTHTGSVSSVTLQAPSGETNTLWIFSGGVEYSISDDEQQATRINKTWLDGAYHFTIHGANYGVNTVTLNLERDIYPKPVHVNNWIATQFVDTNESFTVVWDAIPGGRTGDVVGFDLEDERTSQEVFSSPDPGQPGALDGTSTSAVIPAGTLIPSRVYVGTIFYIKNALMDTTSHPGAVGVSGYSSATGFEILGGVLTEGAGVLVYSSSRYVASSHGGNATITVVRLGGNSGTVSVDFAASGGSAVAGVDYATTSGTLIFADGETSKTFSIAISDHLSKRRQITVGLTLGNPTGGATLGKLRKASVTIVNSN